MLEVNIFVPSNELSVSFVSAKGVL